MRRIARRVHVQFEWKLLPLVIISIIFLMNYTEYCPTYGIPFSQEHQKVNMYLFRGWIVAMSIPLVWNCGYIIRIRKLYPFLLIRLCNRTICFFYEVHKCLLFGDYYYYFWGLIIPHSKYLYLIVWQKYLIIVYGQAYSLFFIY